MRKKDDARLAFEFELCFDDLAQGFSKFGLNAFVEIKKNLALKIEKENTTLLSWRGISMTAMLKANHLNHAQSSYGVNACIIA